MARIQARPHDIFFRLLLSTPSYKVSCVGADGTTLTMLVFPALFTAGMSLLDTIDSMLMYPRLRLGVHVWVPPIPASDIQDQPLLVITGQHRTVGASWRHRVRAMVLASRKVQGSAQRRNRVVPSLTISKA